MTVFSTILNLVAIVATIVNPTNADPTRGMRAESLESMADTSIIKDEISSRIEASFLDDVLLFTQSLSPTHNSMHGSCVEAKNDTELKNLINSSQDGQVRLCPGTIHFYAQIELGKSIAISCSVPGSCILDGNEATRHFVSQTSDITLSFIGLTLINGLADDGSSVDPQGGSVFLSASINIFKHCVFYNNHARSETDNAGGGAIRVDEGETVVNDCLFINNSAVTTATAANKFAGGGAIGTNSNLKVFDSIFKNNKALQVTVGSTKRGGGGAIFLAGNSPADVLVLNSIFELNEASNIGGAANFFTNGRLSTVNWVYNKDLLFGNDASIDCDGVKVNDPEVPAGRDCFNVGDNFSVVFGDI